MGRKDTYEPGESAIRRGRLACTLPPSQRNGWLFARHGRRASARAGPHRHTASNGPSRQPIFTRGNVQGSAAFASSMSRR